jgi:hypothetical protein
MEVASFTVNFLPDHLGSTLHFEVGHFSKGAVVTLKCEGGKRSPLHEFTGTVGIF